MKIKKNPNHKKYIQVLSQMTPEARLLKAFELSDMTGQLFLCGLRRRFPNLNDDKIKKIYLERIKKCYNRNY